MRTWPGLPFEGLWACAQDEGGLGLPRLQLAAADGWTGPPWVLLAGGADGGAKDKQGKTPLGPAEEKGQRGRGESLPQVPGALIPPEPLADGDLF